MAFLSFYDYEKLLCDNMLLSWTVIFTYNRKQCTYITLKHNAYCSTINVEINSEYWMYLLHIYIIPHVKETSVIYT